MIIPTITTISKSGKEAVDILSHDFMENRTIYLFEEINDSTAVAVIAQLAYLDGHGSGDIRLVINSPGGSVTSGFAVADAMTRCKCDVSTVCTGMAASMGAFLFSCGTKGKRYVTPNAEIMIHQPLGGVSGQASDIELTAKHILKIKAKINAILAANTGKSIEAISRDCDRDYYMDAQEAVAYGIADAVLHAQ